MLGVSFSSISRSIVNFYWINLELGRKSTELLDRGRPEQVATAAALKRAINQLTDGEVAATALRFGLNIRSDAMILRNRVERHEMRRHFGADAASWKPALDEPSQESHSTSSPASSNRHSVVTFSPNRVPEQVAVVSSDTDLELLSTGQSIMRFCDPISMELLSQTFKS